MICDEGWNKQNIEAIAGFYAPGQYIERMKQFASRLFTAFPDHRVAIEDLVAEEDKGSGPLEGKGHTRGSMAWSHLDWQDVRYHGD